MSKWSGQGVPPTRRKIHRMREGARREAAALLAARKDSERVRARQAQRMGIDRVLVEREAA